MQALAIHCVKFKFAGASFQFNALVGDLPVSTLNLGRDVDRLLRCVLLAFPDIPQLKS